MLSPIALIRQTRKILLSAVGDLSEKELNAIPTGFNNNIIWNAAHVVTTIHLLCYKNSGVDGYLDDEFVTRYRKGSCPETDVSDKEIQSVKTKLLESVDRLEADYKNGLFQKYKPYTTSFGVALNDIDEAIQFMVIHEGIHLGYVMALKRAIKVESLYEQ